MSLTRLLHVLIYDQHLLIPSICSPPRNSAHLKSSPFLSPDEFCTRKYIHQLLAEVVRHFCCFRRGRDQDLGWSVRIPIREVRREWVGIYVGRCFRGHGCTLYRRHTRVIGALDGLRRGRARIILSLPRIGG